MTRSVRFPLGPLEELTDTTSNVDLARCCGVNPDVISRWRAAGGVPERTADRIATHLSLHPALIWPDWWTAYDDHASSTPDDAPHRLHAHGRGPGDSPTPPTLGGTVAHTAAAPGPAHHQGVTR
jgi:hypothetical protein